SWGWDGKSAAANNQEEVPRNITNAGSLQQRAPSLPSRLRRGRTVGRVCRREDARERTIEFGAARRKSCWQRNRRRGPGRRPQGRVRRCVGNLPECAVRWQAVPDVVLVVLRLTHGPRRDWYGHKRRWHPLDARQ